MSLAIVALNPRAAKVALDLQRAWPASIIYLPVTLGQEASGSKIEPFDDLNELVGRLFASFPRIVFIMPTGIVVRMIAPYLQDKHTDPAVVVVDEAGRFAISLLSGHEGGANRLAIEVANATGAEPVITTAAEAAKRLILGLGARKGIKAEAVLAGIYAALQAVGRARGEVRWVATIAEKAQEPGIIAACASLDLPIRAFSKEQVARFEGNYQRSAFVKEKIGVEGVCEPCVLLSGREMRMLLPKTAFQGVTVAVGEEASTWSASARASRSI
ncbi:MAG: cobalamin biosynthesis protein [Chloroflexi bacterium]|nr:cobalamin biosynthesis protein [Chloroflexota bacterium]